MTHTNICNNIYISMSIEFLLDEIRLENNELSESISQSICDLRNNKLEILTTDCLSKVECDYPTCCTECF